MTDTVQTEIQRAGRPQHAHRTEHRHQIRQQILRHIEAFFGAFDERLVDLHLAHRANEQKQHDQAE
ncbi:hypothetical protein D3C86_1644950 [compost metagenome]